MIFVTKGNKKDANGNDVEGAVLGPLLLIIVVLISEEVEDSSDDS